MKKLFQIFAASTLVLATFVPAVSNAAITPGSVTSLLTSPTFVKASSAQIPLFSFTLSQTASETLSSVAVTLNNVGSSTASSGDFASVNVYKDNGNASFDSLTDLLAGSQTTVNLGSDTIVTTASNNLIDGGKFFVSLATSGTWSSSLSPVDSVSVTFPASGIVTSANSPTISATTTASLTADTAGPVLTGAMAKNTGGGTVKNAGDSVELTFGEATNIPSITSANIASVLQLNNSHTFLDSAGVLGTTSWNSDGKKLTLTLSAGTSLPTVATGDTVTILAGTIKDTAGNNATGSMAITGDFGTQGQDKHHEDEDDDDNDEDSRKVCPAGLINGRLYKIKNSNTVYLVAGCHLKPFRGNAVFKARGHKFQEITILDVLPANAQVSDKPALPAEGTLVKGDKDKTVWFVSRDGHRHGFTKQEIFKKLGFSFDKVEVISQSDLDTMAVGDNVDREDKHPDGSIIKCQNATVVFKINGGKKEPFTSAEAFNAKGHQFKHILSVDCSNFTYPDGTPIQ